MLPAATLMRRSWPPSAASAMTIAATALRKRAQPSCRKSLGRNAGTTAATSKPKPEADAGLSTLGTLFFGGLCASTLGLGVWQSRRYFEKVDQMAVREEEPAADPVPLSRFTANGAGETHPESQQTSAQKQSRSFRRLATAGIYDHTREVLVGPRGPPPGALASSGPTSGRGAGAGMSSSPQGYYVVTPLRIQVGGSDSGENGAGGRWGWWKKKSGDSGNGSGSAEAATVLVNRGWVPMSFVKHAQGQRQKQKDASNDTNSNTWSRPTGTVTVVGVETPTEQPKFLSPAHDRRTPNQLLWMDREALEDRTATAGRNPLLLTETSVTATEGSTSSSSSSSSSSFPVRPSAETVGEFKVTPATHAGYAVTWFGLSGAGVVMTRKLLMRGR